MEVVIGAQGISQALTAYVSLKKLYDLQLTKPHFLIYDLGLAASEAEVQFNEISQLLLALLPKATIQHLYTERHWNDLFTSYLNKAGQFDLLLTRSWQHTNSRIHSKMAAKHKICYGDSIGVHWSAWDFETNPWKRLRQHVTPKAKFDQVVAFFQHGLNHLSYEKLLALEAKDFLEAYDLLNESRIWQTALTAAQTTAAINTLLLCNFSEAGLMSPESELQAVLNSVQTSLAKGSTIWVKSHPRNSINRVQMYINALNNAGFPTLWDAKLDRIPFELVLRSWQKSERALGKVVGFSSALLSAACVLGLDTRLGFGSALKGNLISKPYASWRQQHERLLVEISNGYITSV